MKHKAFSFDYREDMDVKEFLEKQNDFGRIYVCCDSGESRSTAMAAAIMRYYGKSDKEIWTNPHYHPNLLVYKEQLYAFGIKVSKLRLSYLKYINNRALKRAINGKKQGVENAILGESEDVLRGIVNEEGFYDEHTK